MGSWHGEPGSQSAFKARPHETTHAGDNTHKKATRLDMSVRRFKTEYPVSTVMNGFRGDPSPREQTGVAGGKDFNFVSESGKRGKLGY